MKAVVELGGKQYLVEPGTIFLAEKVPVEKGGSYTTDRVLLLLDGDDVVLGKPYVEKARVTFSVLDQTKRRKVIVQKFRPKKGYLKTRGHRQLASQLQVELIEGAGKKEKRVVEKKKRKKAEAAKAAPRRKKKPVEAEAEPSEEVEADEE
jgi:large subunit ribosomal protein L21